MLYYIMTLIPKHILIIKLGLQGHCPFQHFYGCRFGGNTKPMLAIPMDKNPIILFGNTKCHTFLMLYDDI